MSHLNKLQIIIIMTKLSITLTLFIALNLVSCSTNQSNTKLILDNALEITVPDDFQYSKKKFNENSIAGDIEHDFDYFANKDKSKEISFIKLPSMGANIDIKSLANITLLSSQADVISKREKNINNIKTYMIEYIGFDEGIKKYTRMIYYKLDNNFIVGNFSSSPENKDSWSKQSLEIINSIKLHK